MIRTSPLAATAVALTFLALTVFSVHKAHADLVCESLFADRLSQSGQSTVSVSLVDDGNGEPHFVLRRKSGLYSWFSRYSEHGFDPQGNPLAVFLDMGHEFATVMGIREGRERTLLVPAPETMNMRIAQFNQFLRKRSVRPIEISFFSQPVATRESFLQNWTNRSLPVAEGLSNHTVHDISFHYNNLLLPPEVVDLLQIQAEIALEWAQFSRTDVTQSKSISSAVRMIDFFSTSANFEEDGIGKKKVADNLANFLRLNLQGYVKMSPFVTVELEDVLQNRLQTVSSLDLFEHVLASYEEGSNKTRSEFRKHALANHPTWMQTLAARGLDNFDTVYKLYVTRADELRTAARKFLKQ